MRAIIVSVNYSDLLRVTLPYNKHHFDEVFVVTDLNDLASCQVGYENGAKVFSTDSFYENGAIFNKWRALELGLTAMGRSGWLCIMDADVLWPKVTNWQPTQAGILYTPHRRMFKDLTQPIPPEEDWRSYPRHRELEFAGYSQIFHAEDEHLGAAPWHQTDWTHAGGADSFFQRKWTPREKVRPPFEVLHLGLDGRNWCGRTTPYLDGRTPKEAETRRRHLNNIFNLRRKNRNFDHERIK